MSTYAIIDTTKGKILTILDMELAPITATNFRDLATGAKAWKDPRSGEMKSTPFYDGLTFHRVAKNFVVQAGCPLGTGTGGPGSTIKLEIHPDLRHDKAGVLSMARSQHPDSAGSQFFITLKDTAFLDDNYAVFGHAIDGLDVVKALGDTPIRGGQDGPPTEELLINKITIVEGTEDEARAQM